uniref:PARG catalytic Macro domain-containing protein n=1 Tax=Haptolina ericina TaxID=156174 RepID=A0A7S3ERN2_9EUKA
MMQQPSAAGEVFVVRGARRFSICSGPPHAMRFIGPAPLGSPEIDLVCMGAIRRPGGEQFERDHVTRELHAAVAGLVVLRDGAPRRRAIAGSAAEADSVVCCCVTGLWGCGGFSGSQPVMRMLLLVAAASIVGVELRVCLPPADTENYLRWYAGVLAEVGRQQPALGRLVDVLSNETAVNSTRLAHDVPAFASFVIKQLRALAAGDERTAQQELSPSKRLKTSES